MSRKLPPWVEAQGYVAGQTQRRIEDLFTEHLEGKVTRTGLIAQLMVWLRITAEKAVALADKYTTLQLEEIDGKPRQPQGWTFTQLPEGDELLLDELSDNYPEDTDEDHRGAALAALVVTGRAYTLGALQQGRQASLRGHEVRYWRRGVEPGACEICHDLADGILPMDQEPWFHKGCGCTQEPVLPGH